MPNVTGVLGQSAGDRDYATGQPGFADAALDQGHNLDNAVVSKLTNEWSATMITVIAHFKFPRPVAVEKAREAALGTAPRYIGVRGLIRKYYTLAADGMSGGGIYLWKSREDADRMYNEEWKAFVRGRYGCEPTLTYLETPVIVDNVANEIVSDR